MKINAYSFCFHSIIASLVRDEDFKLLFEEDYGIEARELFRLFWDPNSRLWNSFLEDSEMTNFRNYDETKFGKKSSFVMGMHSPIGPKTANVEMIHEFHNVSTPTGTTYVNEITHLVLDYPYADYFNIMDRFEFEEIEEKKCHFKLYTKQEWVKETYSIIKMAIQRSVEKTQEKDTIAIKKAIEKNLENEDSQLDRHVKHFDSYEGSISESNKFEYHQIAPKKSEDTKNESDDKKYFDLSALAVSAYDNFDEFEKPTNRDVQFNIELQYALRLPYTLLFSVLIGLIVFRCVMWTLTRRSDEEARLKSQRLEKQMQDSRMEKGEFFVDEMMKGLIAHNEQKI